jgi:hypothetical protein
MKVTKGLQYVLMGVFFTIEFCGQFYCYSEAVHMSKNRGYYHHHHRERRDVAGIENFLATLRDFHEVDVIFVLDRSAGVGQHNFILKEIKLIRSIINHFALITPERARVAVITFGKDSEVAFDHITKEPLVKCQLVESEALWTQVKYYNAHAKSHGTNIEGALKDSLDILTEGKRIRTGVMQIILLMTDGELDSNLIESQSFTELKENIANFGVDTYGVGIGSYLNTGIVKRLVSREEYYGAMEEWKNMMPEYSNSRYDQYHVVVNYKLDYSNLYEYDGCSGCLEHSTCVCDVITGYSNCLSNPGYSLQDNTVKCKSIVMSL